MKKRIALLVFLSLIATAVMATTSFAKNMVLKTALTYPSSLPILGETIINFSDKVKDGTYIAKFRDQLIATPYFSDKTKITRLSNVRSSDYAIEFTLRLALTDKAVLQ